MSVINNLNFYASPEIEVLEIEAEQCFAVSGETVEDMTEIDWSTGEEWE